MQLLGLTPMASPQAQPSHLLEQMQTSLPADQIEGKYRFRVWYFMEKYK